MAERETSFEFRDIKGGCVPEFLLRHVDRMRAGKVDLIHGNGVHFSPTPRKPPTADGRRSLRSAQLTHSRPSRRTRIAFT